INIVRSMVCDDIAADGAGWRGQTGGHGVMKLTKWMNNGVLSTALAILLCARFATPPFTQQPPSKKEQIDAAREAEKRRAERRVAAQNRPATQPTNPPTMLPPVNP